MEELLQQTNVEVRNFEGAIEEEGLVEQVFTEDHDPASSCVEHDAGEEEEEDQEAVFGCVSAESSDLKQRPALVRTKSSMFVSFPSWCWCLLCCFPQRNRLLWCLARILIHDGHVVIVVCLCGDGTPVDSRQKWDIPSADQV